MDGKQTENLYSVTSKTLDDYLASADWLSRVTPEQRSVVVKNLVLILDDYLGDALYGACEEFVDSWESE